MEGDFWVFSRESDGSGRWGWDGASSETDSLFVKNAACAIAIVAKKGSRFIRLFLWLAVGFGIECVRERERGFGMGMGMGMGMGWVPGNESRDWET
ncbi:unnamed protein product [Prunus armeniaca]|uniref:Uncharacterized protein n=1 Tax=Prunus armeniaca TaxID=36596 RepID=A0A6J5X2G0_PRUAR|nr:unnamed protein product [Prunus armeniaca]